MEAKGKYRDIPKRISGLTELAYNFWWSCEIEWIDKKEKDYGMMIRRKKRL